MAVRGAYGLELGIHFAALGQPVILTATAGGEGRRDVHPVDVAAQVATVVQIGGQNRGEASLGNGLFGPCAPFFGNG